METKTQTLLPVISVVIPIKNGQPYIAKTLESVIKSNSPNFRIEIIAIDNHSNDGTSEYLETITSTNIKVIRPKESLPIHENWTLAINAASGSFIKLLCADDILDPDCLSSQFEILASTTNHDVSAVFGTRNIIDEFDNPVWGVRQINLPEGSISGIVALKAIVRAGTNILGEPLTALFRTDAIKESMPWPAEHPYMLDLGGYLPILLTRKIYISSITCGSYRAHNGTLSRSLRKSQASQYIDFMIQLPLDLNFFELVVMRMKAKIQQFKRRLFFAAMRYKVSKIMLIKITETLTNVK
jgi:glycosyltransferase involved in cell wall biosynthesis